MLAQKASQAGLELIRLFEGLGPNIINNLIYPYICPAGHLTIGYGHKIKEAEAAIYFIGLTLKEAHALYKQASKRKEFYEKCRPLSLRQADALLLKDVAYFEAEVNERMFAWKIMLPNSIFTAFVCFAHNNGEGGLDQTIKNRLLKGQILEAVLWMPQFCMADIEIKPGKWEKLPVTGLTLRRFSEVYLAITGKCWRIGQARATRQAEIDRFIGEVKSHCKAKGKLCPLPYDRNLMKNQAA